MSELLVTALGAVTSVGLDAATTCASIRAGITRPVPLDGPSVLDGVEYEEVAVTGHCARTLTRGFSSIGRWLQLLPLAIEDLCSGAALPKPALDPGFWSRTACLIVVPAPGERFLTDYECAPRRLHGALVPRLLERCGERFAPGHIELCPLGSIGALSCAAAARDGLGRGAYARVIILAVDSLVDRPALDWLSSERRLKTPDNPAGTSPGEGSAGFMLESPGAARARGAQALARFVRARTAPAAIEAADDVLRRADELAAVIAQAAAPHDGRMGAPGPIVTDLNGEQWRASAFGLAHLKALRRSAWSAQPTWLPLASTGDVGAATGALQVVVACRALQRGYAEGSAALSTTLGEYGGAGAALLLEGDTDGKG